MLVAFIHLYQSWRVENPLKSSVEKNSFKLKKKTILRINVLMQLQTLHSIFILKNDFFFLNVFEIKGKNV